MSRLLEGFMIFLIFSGFISHSHALEVSQLQWDNGTLNRLYRGEVVTYIGYSVEVVAFPQPVESEKYKSIPEEPVEPYVGLNISKNGSFNDTIILGFGESYITLDGDLKITAKELPSKNAKEWLFESYNPWAVIELNPIGIPDLEVSIDTQDNEYISLSDTEIVATVTLKNKGSADAVSVDMRVVTELPIKRGKLKYHYDRVRKGEVIHETIAFSSPILTEIKVKSPSEIPPTPAEVLPVIDSPDNSADSGVVNGLVNGSDETLSDEPMIDEPVSDEHPNEVNTIFYNLLGCNEDSNGNFNDAHSVCNFFTSLPVSFE